ncbi:unnamed protein product, partial [Prorocentrum cordatum]
MPDPIPAETPCRRSRLEVLAAGPGAKRTLTVKAAVRLPKDLPQMQVRSTGAACFVLRFSPDGSQIAGGFYDGGLRIYDVDTASMEHCLNLPPLQSPKADVVAARCQSSESPLCGRRCVGGKD